MPAAYNTDHHGLMIGKYFVLSSILQVNMCGCLCPSRYNNVL